jgi:hypothetical protein
MLNCKQASELMSQAQDRDISLRERLSLRLHLLVCRGCRNFFSQLDVMRAACRRYLDR